MEKFPTSSHNPSILDKPPAENLCYNEHTEPLGLMFTFAAVVIGMVYDYLPFMVLPIYASLEKIKRAQIEASFTLGASPWRTFIKITFPQSMPGVVAGVILVFIPALGEFVVPRCSGNIYDDRNHNMGSVPPIPRLVEGISYFDHLHDHHLRGSCSLHEKAGRIEI